MQKFQRLLKILPLTLLLLQGFTHCTPKSSAEMNQSKQENINFLTENQKKPDVKTTASGLQYQVLKDGTGDKPKATDVVTVNYQGSLISGKTFDSGEGISFPLNGVIAGWTEGLQLMQTGARYRFFIPSELAYGERGAGSIIPPNSTLIFDVDLIKIGR